MERLDDAERQMITSRWLEYEANCELGCSA